MLNNRTINTEVINNIAPPNAGGTIISFRQRIGFASVTFTTPPIVVRQIVNLQTNSSVSNNIVFRQKVVDQTPSINIITCRQRII